MNDRTDIRAFGDELRDEFRLAVAGLRDGSLPQRLDELSDAVDAAAAAGSGGMEADSTPEAPEGDPPAFSVRWDPTLSDGAGGWAVYLPTEHLLSYDGADVPTSSISGITAVEGGDGNDTPWYSLDKVGEDAGHVWLVLTVPDSGPVEAEFAEEEGQAASGGKVVNVCVAEIARDMEDPEGNPLPVVRQSLSGALHLGSGSTEFLHPFEVRWSASARNKQGAWVIWLPDASSLVHVNNAYVSQINNIVAEAALPAGWYRMSPVSATTTAVWLIVRTSTLTGAVRAHLGAYPEQPQTGYTVSSILVATMAVDAQTGAKRVKQFVDSAVVLGGGGGGAVTLDDVSTDFSGDGEVQIKDWDTGTPASPTTIAQDIHDADGATAQGSVVERTTGGVLQYKQPGTLEQLLGSSVEKSSQKILTGLRWDTSSHQLVISSANITVANGVITSWTDNNDENIATTPISDIV